MSYLLKHSPQCVKSELDLFALPPSQVVIQKGTYFKYFPLTNVNDGGPIEFHIAGSAEDYMNLSQTLLYVKARIVRGDGTFIGTISAKTDAATEDAVGTVNLLLHSLFSQIDVTLNDRLISSSNNTYAYRAYIETLLNHGHDSKTSQLTMEMFYKDTAGKMNDLELNKGLTTRTNFFKKSKVVDMYGGLHCDLFYQNRLMLNLVNLKLRFTRSKPEFCLLSPTDEANYKITLEHASLLIRKVKVAPGVLLGHAKALAQGTAKYPIDRVLCKVYSLPQGSMSWIQDNIVNGQLPKRIVIGFIDNDAYNGTYKKSPFEFKHYHLNFLCVYVDGEPTPYNALEPQFDQNVYIQAYHSLFLGTEKAAQDKGIDISRSDYANGYTLYAYDLSPDLCDGGHLNLLKHGNLRIEAKFKTPLTQTICALVYLEFDNVIEINQNRNILYDFSS